MHRTSLDMGDDSILMNELKGGSSRAFDVIFRKYYDNLCRFAFSLVKDADISQSLVQNVFVKLWERRHQADDIRNLAGYLTMMVKNQVYDYIHDHKNSKLVFKDAKPGITDESTEKEIFRRNFEECLIIALTKLPDRCRQAFELSRFESLPNKEIAKKMDISVKGVEALIGRSLKILRVELREFLPSFQLKDNLLLFFFGILPVGVYVDKTGITKN